MVKYHGSASLFAIMILALPIAAQAQPMPSSWNVQNSFTPGGAHSLAMPWQTYQASGTNCQTIGAQLTTPWTQQAWTPQVSGVAAATQTSAGHNMPAIFRNNLSSPVSYPPESLTIYPGQVALHPGNDCALLRFKAPVDGIYTIRGEFWSPTGSSHPNNVTARVLDKGVQAHSGTVSAGSANQWIIPNPTQQYQLQAGQTIDFAVDNGGNGYYSDTTLLTAEVKWIDNLPNTFKASKFDFEGGQGCAIEQGTDKLYCWGANNWGQLGRITAGNSNVAVLAQRVENHIGANATGPAKNLQVGAYNACILTTGTNKILCWGANNALQSGMATLGQVDTTNSPAHGVRDLTTQLGSTKVKIDGLTGCLINGASKVQCWGHNIINTNTFGGILGWKNGSAFTGSHLPLANVPNVDGASQLAPGGTMSCAIVSATARVNCWGNTPWGAALLGGGASPTLLPHPDNIAQTYVLTAPSTPLLQVQKIEVSGIRACALKAGGSLWCWGMNNTYGELIGAPMGSQTPIPPNIVSMALALPAPFNSGVTDFALSSNGLCAVKGGQVYCLGRNVDGQLGKPPQTGTVEWRTPFATYSGHTNVVVDVTPIPGFTNVSKIRGGDRSFCALKTSGEIWCWGANIQGQLGAGLATGTGATSITPVRVIK